MFILIIVSIFTPIITPQHHEKASMRFRLLLEVNKRAFGNQLPINCQYEQSAAVYKILSNADKAYAAWLHDNGFIQGIYQNQVTKTIDARLRKAGQKHRMNRLCMIKKPPLKDDGSEPNVFTTE